MMSPRRMGGGEPAEISEDRPESMRGAMGRAVRGAGQYRTRRERDRPSPREPTPRTASDIAATRRQLASLREAGGDPFS